MNVQGGQARCCSSSFADAHFGRKFETCGADGSSRAGHRARDIHLVAAHNDPADLDRLVTWQKVLKRGRSHLGDRQTEGERRTLRERRDEGGEGRG